MEQLPGKLAEELIVYARQMAWLNAIPRDDRKKTLQGGDREEPVSRLKTMEADGIEPAMPPLSAPVYIEYLLEIGPTEPAGMGAAVISWRTLQAWQEATGIVLQPWELRLLRSLSAEWLAESDRASKPDCPAPWAGEATELNREAVARKMELMFDRLERRPRK